VQVKGQPIFWYLFDLEGVSAEQEDRLAEELRREIAERLQRHDPLNARRLRQIVDELARPPLRRELLAEVA
jgi:hypothetical protein